MDIHGAESCAAGILGLRKPEHRMKFCGFESSKSAVGGVAVLRLRLVRLRRETDSGCGLPFRDLLTKCETLNEGGYFFFLFG